MQLTVSVRCYLYLVAVGWLSACAVHQPTVDREPLVPADARFREAGEISGNAAGEPASWWRYLEEAPLDELMDEALSHNLELQQLVARIEQADALLRQAGAQLFPTLDAAGDYSVEWDDDGGRTESASVGGLLNWELDVWGRLRSLRKAASYDARAAYQDWRAARLLLTAAVAETYFEIVEQRLQLNLLAEQIDVNTTLLDLTRLRFGQGQSSIVDVLQQREQLASTRVLVPAVEARLEQLEYSLDVLVGRAPGGRPRVDRDALAVVPPFPAVGVPANLLENRPDLVALKHRMDAVDYRVGAAIADRLPRIRIGGSLRGIGTPDIGDLLGAAFADAVAPVFDGGERRAEVDRQQALLAEALAAYSQAYLRAVQDVETAILRERKQEETVALLQNELTIAQQLLRETRNRYSQGLTDYLPVLAAVVRVQNLQRDLITSRRQRISFRVALHRSAGGSLVTDGTEVTALRSEIGEDNDGIQ